MSEIAKRIEKYTLYFLVLSLVFLSINGFPYNPSWLGELSVEFVVWTLSPACFMTVLLLGVRQFYMPRDAIMYLLIAFLLVLIYSWAMNYPSISDSVFKGRAGEHKFLLQLLLVISMYVLTIAVFNVTALCEQDLSRKLFILQSVVLVSLCLPVFYSILVELPIQIFSLEDGSMLQQISLLVHDNDYPHRLRSLSMEASYFGNYLAIVWPWLLAAVIDKRRNSWWGIFFAPMIILMCYLTFSRTVYGMVIGESVVLFAILFMYRDSIKTQVSLQRLIYAMVIAGALIGAVRVYENIQLAAYNENVELSPHGKKSRHVFGVDEYDESNTTRMTSNLAAIKMGRDNLLSGVGFGQYGFYAKDYLLDAGPVNQELEQLKSDIPGTPWPPVYNLYARIFAETGVIGLAMWLLLWLFVLKAAVRISLSLGKDDVNGVALVATVFGMMAVGVGFDSFRYIPYWLIIGLVMALSSNLRESKVR